MPPDPRSADQVGEPISTTVRRWVKPQDLNAHGTLFGGVLLQWIDEEAAIYAILQVGTHRLVTKFVSEVEFVSSAVQGDLVEVELAPTAFGRTSVTLRAEARNMITGRRILTIDRIVFVTLGDDGRPAPHGYSEPTARRDRIPREGGQDRPTTDLG